MKRCEVCCTNDGMVPDQPDGGIVWCDHGELRRKIAAAEEADRARAERHEASGRKCPAHDDGYGPCRCPDE